ncbi:hypothetical protein K437DRAFT_243794 [Tilletiaria anomala UBC 951]|uniref:Phospholipid/glycerol acyltransferase domain-containing protein n=1 Tax=Tilletiaria anomala (strain ATCC 24038 / CBS 436.72 / UBC 951) TaxID=1037660 RepID=A0A066WP13_TILAU|nr:uncharacterized protein K437DRAFT_243794 [Tilletiaria anomala UBC 951]KDN52330.1 hypothetical protein K437DRAFT_243794 [Tilletiaria anomala UBC 951]
MEKFSRFRDPGTGIQVFLTPVPPVGAGKVFAQILTPVALIVGVIRAALVLVTFVIWIVLNTLLGSINAFLISVFGRATLFWLGFAWLNAEVISLQKRGRAASSVRPLSSIKPTKGSIIVSNWSSWVDVLYISILFNPLFLAPVVAPSPTSAQSSPARSRENSRSASNSPTTARRRNAGAEVVTEANNAPASLGPSSRLLGFRKVSMWDMITASGETPMIRGDKNGKQDFKDIETLARKADRPVCIFPELVTSNNRGLLRMNPIFPASWRAMFRATGALRLGAGQPDIYIISIKHTPPSTQSPSSVLSVPGQRFNPLTHVWSLCASLNFSRSLQVRVLNPEESPSSEAFVADALVATTSAADPISELCGNLISQLSRLKRTGLGWEDKESFLALYRERRKP